MPGIRHILIAWAITIRETMSDERRQGAWGRVRTMNRERMPEVPLTTSVRVTPAVHSASDHIGLGQGIRHICVGS